MASVNKVILIGNLGRDPETRTFPNGGQVTNATIATTEKWKDKQSGEQREATEWHRIVFRDRLAEIAAQYLKKGSSIYVEGSIKTRKYNDKDGVERYATEIQVFTLQMLSGKPEGGQQGGGGSQQGGQQRSNNNGGQQQSKPQQNNGGGFDSMDDDIPF